jgi:hypothetical protein
MHGAKFFEVQKADGTLAKVEFQDPAPDPDDVTVNGTAEEVAALGKLMNEHGLTLAELVEKAVPAFIQDKIAAKAKEGAAAAAKEGEAEEELDADGKPKAKAPPAKSGEGDADPAAAAAAAEEAEKAATNESLEKLEAAFTDALAKVGARNSGVDMARITKIHDMAVELGAACAPAEKLDNAGDLAKAEGALQKLVADAVAPLQKLLDDQAKVIEKLSKQPAPARINLRAIANWATSTKPQASSSPSTQPAASGSPCRPRSASNPLNPLPHPPNTPHHSHRRTRHECSDHCGNPGPAEGGPGSAEQRTGKGLDAIELGRQRHHGL